MAAYIGVLVNVDVELWRKTIEIETSLRWRSSSKLPFCAFVSKITTCVATTSYGENCFESVKATNRMRLSEFQLKYFA